MDLLEDEAGNTPEFSVSEISGAVKRVVEGEFGHVRVRGEIGRVSRPRSGHIYLDLKDDRSVLSGVIWKGRANALTTLPEEGMEMIATGRLTTFPGQSKYQIVIEDLQPAGEGALMAMLEKRKKALEAEGLFAAERKRPLPFLPEIIGVVTSPSGAVIRDILHRLQDRFPRKVLVWPVAVQGANCAPEVTRAIEGFNAMSPGGALPRPDLLIVARGGGSIEDLWGFNEESVARAAAASQIPLISAVGHETDTTLIDFVSDRRAPTPSAAAELAVPVRRELMVWLEGQEGRLGGALSRLLDLRQQRLRDLARALTRPERLTEQARQRLDVAGDRLPAALRSVVGQRRVALSEAAGSLRPATLRAHIASERRHLAQLDARLGPALKRAAHASRERYEHRAGRLRAGPLLETLGRRRDRLENVSTRVATCAAADLAARRDRLASLDRLRETLGYRETLRRGYAVVRGDGEVVTTTAAAEAAGALEIEFHDGRVTTSAGEAKSAAPVKPATPKKPKGPPAGQGSLF